MELAEGSARKELGVYCRRSAVRSKQTIVPIRAMVDKKCSRLLASDGCRFVIVVTNTAAAT